MCGRHQWHAAPGGGRPADHVRGPMDDRMALLAAHFAALHLRGARANGQSESPRHADSATGLGSQDVRTRLGGGWGWGGALQPLAYKYLPVNEMPDRSFTPMPAGPQAHVHAVNGGVVSSPATAGVRQRATPAVVKAATPAVVGKGAAGARPLPDPKLMLKFVTAASRFVNYCASLGWRRRCARASPPQARLTAGRRGTRAGPGGGAAIAFSTAMLVMMQYEWWNTSTMWWTGWPHMIECVRRAGRPAARRGCVPNTNAGHGRIRRGGGVRDDVQAAGQALQLFLLGLLRTPDGHFVLRAKDEGLLLDDCASRGDGHAGALLLLLRVRRRCRRARARRSSSSSSGSSVISQRCGVLARRARHRPRYYRIGLPVMAIHDVSDPFMEIAKAFNYCHAKVSRGAGARRAMR